MPCVHSSSASPVSAATGLEIRPFQALTYRQRDPDHLARVSSPAYDLVSAEGRQRLAAADPCNIVRLILPGVEPTVGAAVGETPAQRSAHTLRDWQAAKVLERDEVPAMWMYEMRPPGDRPATRGWLGAVALPEPGSHAILPHEDTYAPAVEGRRALLAATATDLEPIVLAHDSDPTVASLTADAGRGSPTIEIRDHDGVRHRLWRITDPAVLGRLQQAFRGTGAVIADGHHRFAAAQAHLRGGSGDGAVLAVVTPMGAGGLHVDPIHRVVPGLTLADARERAARGFRIREIELASAGAAAPAPADAVASAVRSWLAGDDAGFLVSDGRSLLALDEPAAEVHAAVPVEAPDAWRRLDVVLAHHGLLHRLWDRDDDPTSVGIAHSVEEGLQMALERAGVALFLHAPSPTAVAQVARAGVRMPRKSTLFVPKPRTGLVLRPLH